MEISLIRHGRSLYQENHPISNQEFHDWVKGYDGHGVFDEKQYPQETVQNIQSSNLILTSELIRSIESAKYLYPTGQFVSHSIFKEIEVPIISKSIKGIKLNPSIWLVIYRTLWLLGYSRGCESFQAAKKRAREAATLLTQYVQEHKKVTLVGHGIFNRLIAKELQKMGWKGKRKTSTKHWSCTTYRWKGL